MNGILIRPLEEADLDAVAALHAASFAALATGHHDARQIAAFVADTSAPAYREELMRNRLRLAMAPDGAVLGSAGWCDVAGRPEAGRIRKVFVRPDMAGRGLGRRLVGAAEDEARALGRTLLTVRANANAESFYARLGYRAIERGAMATPAGIDLPVVFMEKPA